MRETLFPRTAGAVLLAFLLVAMSFVVAAPSVGAQAQGNPPSVECESGLWNGGYWKLQINAGAPAGIETNVGDDAIAYEVSDGVFSWTNVHTDTVFRWLMKLGNEDSSVWDGDWPTGDGSSAEMPGNLSHITVCFSDPEVPPAPVCPVDGAIVATFDGDQIRSDTSEARATSNRVAVTIPAGIYDIWMASYDDHSSDPDSVGQANEQWVLQGLSSSAIVFTSARISDLPNDQDYILERVEVAASVPDLDAVQAFHPEWFAFRQPNSVVPLWACLVPIEEPGTIIVDKVTDPGQSEQQFGFNASWLDADIDFSLTDAAEPWSGTVDPGDGFSVTEVTADDGWHLSGSVCESDESGTVEQPFSVAAGETVTCTFTNVPDDEPPGRIVVDKVTAPSGSEQLFPFEIWQTESLLDEFSLADETTPYSVEVPAGAYSVFEDAVAGWDLTGAWCTSDFDRSGFDPRVAGFEVSAGETVTCTFTNSERPTITVEKVTNVSNGEHFEFTLVGPFQDQELLATALVQISDPRNVSLPGGGSHSWDVQPGSYDLFEYLTADQVGDWTFASVVCNVENDPWTEDGGESGFWAGAFFSADYGDHVVCTFTNRTDIPPPPPTTTTTTTTTVPALGSIGDLVWVDADSNEIQGAGEPGVAGVIVELFDADTDALLGIRVTDANGKYLFENLEPGDYYLVFTLPEADDEFIAPNMGGNPALDSDAANTVNIGRTSVITVVAGEDLTWDAGVAFVAVAGVQITTSTVSVSPETLPFTGADFGESGMAGIAFALLVLGGVALLTVRRREDQIEVVSGWSGRLWDVE